jgi:hypothetical protein
MPEERDVRSRPSWSAATSAPGSALWRLRTVALLDADLQTLGASLGARAIFALPEAACGIVEAARVARYLAQQSAGEWRWLDQVDGRGACRHPDGAARLVASALCVFAAEWEWHSHGSCAGAGRPLLPLKNGRVGGR